MTKDRKKYEKYFYFFKEDIHMINNVMPTQIDIDQIKLESSRFSELPNEISKVIVGQSHIIDLIVNAILCKGHILLEGVPGVAKTTMIKAVASALGLTFNGG